MNLLVLTVFIMVTLLLVSFLLIMQYHLALISPSVRGFSCISLSHLRTQIKYADSDRMIWKGWVGPWCIIFHCCCWLFLLSLSSFPFLFPELAPRFHLFGCHGCVWLITQWFVWFVSQIPVV